MRICLYFIPRRLPTQKYASQRKLWLESIEKVQPVDHNSRAFNVCIAHFHASQIVKLEENYTLAPDAIPSIFINTLKRQTNANTPGTVSCNNCLQMTRKNSQLTSDNIACDIERQSMQKTIDSLRKKTS